MFSRHLAGRLARATISDLARHLERGARARTRRPLITSATAEHELIPISSHRIGDPAAASKSTIGSPTVLAMASSASTSARRTRRSRSRTTRGDVAARAARRRAALAHGPVLRAGRRAHAPARRRSRATSRPRARAGSSSRSRATSRARRSRARTIFGRRWQLDDMIAAYLRQVRAAAPVDLGTRCVIGRPVRYWGAETADDDARAVGRMRDALAQGRASTRSCSSTSRSARRRATRRGSITTS